MKEKKYISDIPELMKEWDWEANVGLDPTKLTIGSNKKAWWKCSKCDHKWLAVVSSRGCGHRGCPACAKAQQGYKLVKIFANQRGSLAEKRPELAKEWLSDKNGDLTPNDVTIGSGKKVWWKCSECGYEWCATVIDRKEGHGCPSCAKIHRIKKRVQLLIKRKGSLAEKYPKLAKEWHPTRNGDLKPIDVTARTNRKVWWLCPVGHEYQAQISNRSYGYTNCSICNLRQKTSFPEQAIFYYIKKLWPNASNKYKDCFKNSMEFDIYIPELKTAIEYDGAQWHKTDSEYKREVKKYEFCKKNEIFLIRVKEQSKQSWEDTADKIYCVPKINKRNYHALELLIYQLLSSMCVTKQPLEIDIEKDKNNILNYLSKIDNSLADMRPDIASKWNYEKNANLTPNMFSIGSDEVVWWKCPDCGNEWKSSIKDMVKHTYGCPICARVQKGKTRIKYYVKKQGSLAKKMPELVQEWHPTKNGNLNPNDITIGSHTKVWWKCLRCGYEWQAEVRRRGIRGTGCPCCAGQKVLHGFNDLATTHPELANEWHPSKNGKLNPKNITAGSSKSVWWKCQKCGHEWQTTVSGRRGCPKCVKKKNKGQLSFDLK